MTNPKIVASTTDSTSILRYNFYDSTNAQTYVDGLPRVRTQNITVKNTDLTTGLSVLGFSFDQTNYLSLRAGESFQANIETTSIFIKSMGGGGGTFQFCGILKSWWK